VAVKYAYPYVAIELWEGCCHWILTAKGLVLKDVDYPLSFKKKKKKKERGLG